MKPFLTPKRILAICLLFPGLLAAGTAGYMALQGWSFFDGLYMALITVSTVGYHEVGPLNSGGRVLTGMLILSTILATPVLGALVTTWFFENTFQILFRERRMKQKLDRMDHHVVICGMGRMGREVARRLHEAGMLFVGIDQNMELLDELRNLHPDWNLLHGDSTSEEILEQAHVDKAGTLVAALGSDPDNLFLALSAKEIAPGIKLIARAETENGSRRLSQVGVENIVTPVTIGARRISDMISDPHFLEYLDTIDAAKGNDVHVFIHEVAPESPLCGKTLAELALPGKTQLLVVAVKEGEGAMTYSPNAGLTVKTGHKLFLSGPKEGLERFRQLFDRKHV